MTEKRHPWGNFALFFLDYVFFGIAFGLIGNTTVVPDFVARLTNSETITGLVSSLYMVAWLLPQLVLAQLINRTARRKPFMTYTVMPFRLTMLIVAIAVAATSADNHTALLVIFLTGYILFALGDGLITLVWADMLGSTIPDRWRGALFSIAQIVVAFAALGSREVVRRLLGPDGPPFPQNFAQVFGLSAVMFLIAGVCLMLLKEGNTEEVATSGPPLREYLPYLGNVLKTDRAFRIFVGVRLLVDMTMLAAPFYVLFGTDLIATMQHIPREQIAGEIVGNSILLSTFGSAAGGLMMSWLSHQSGSRAVIAIAAVASCIHPALALVSMASAPFIYGVFFALGFVNSSIVPGYFDWIITHSPPDRRPIYVGLTNTLSAISHLAPFFGGVILSISSYPVLFSTALLIGIAGLASVVFLPEPRRRVPPQEAEHALVTE